MQIRACSEERWYWIREGKYALSFDWTPHQYPNGIQNPDVNTTVRWTLMIQPGNQRLCWETFDISVSTKGKNEKILQWKSFTLNYFYVFRIQKFRRLELCCSRLYCSKVSRNYHNSVIILNWAVGTTVNTWQVVFLCAGMNTTVHSVTYPNAFPCRQLALVEWRKLRREKIEGALRDYSSVLDAREEKYKVGLRCPAALSINTLHPRSSGSHELMDFSSLQTASTYLGVMRSSVHGVKLPKRPSMLNALRSNVCIGW